MTAVGLIVALACAEALGGKGRWSEATSLYSRAAGLAHQADAPAIEWRAWYAAGDGYEQLGNDQAALRTYRQAMDVIDRLWFALLDEGKLRGFFADKALLYDRRGSAVCD